MVEESERTRKIDLRLGGGDDRELRFFAREPLRAPKALPAVLLLAGFETGRDALDLIDERTDAILLAMSYPYDGPLPLRGTNLVLALPALRRMAIDTLEAGRIALDYLAARADVDPARITLVGVSFGSIFVTLLGACDTRPDAVVLIYGGGDLGAIASHAVRDRWIPGPVAGAVVRFVFGDLDPLHAVAAISPRHLLLVNSTRDEIIPERSVRALYEQAGPPKELLWYETGHMDLFDPAVVRPIVADVVERLAAAGIMDAPS